MRKKSTANFTNSSVTTPCRAVITPVKNNLEVEFVPSTWREKGLQVFFSLQNRPSVRQFPPLSQSVDVCVHRKGRNSKGLSHDHLGCLVTNTRQRLQIREISRNNAPMLIEQYLRQALDSPGFLRPQPAGPYDLLDTGRRLPGKLLRRAPQRAKETRRDLVDAHICALSREKNRDQQSEWI